MPCANRTWTSNEKDAIDKQSIDSPSLRFQAISSTEDPSAKTESKLPLRSCSSATRGTLSQPCMSENKTVGATSIFSHLFLGSQQDVMDEVSEWLVIISPFFFFLQR